MTDDYAGRYWDEVNKVSVADRGGQNAGEVPGKRELKERVCQACGAVFLSTGWHVKWCPECRALKRRECRRRYAQSQSGREKRRAYCESHVEELRRIQHVYYERHREKRQAATREYRENNPEKVRETQRVYRENNPEKVREWLRKDGEKRRLARRARKGDGTAAFELLKLRGKVEECPRTHIRAVNLPCGRESYCWGGKPCERATSRGCKRPVEASCGWMDF